MLHILSSRSGWIYYRGVERLMWQPKYVRLILYFIHAGKTTKHQSRHRLKNSWCQTIEFCCAVPQCYTLPITCVFNLDKTSGFISCIHCARSDSRESLSSCDWFLHPRTRTEILPRLHGQCKYFHFIVACLSLTMIVHSVIL